MMGKIQTSEKNSGKITEDEVIQDERSEALQNLSAWLETPMLFLAFIWLGLLAAELIWGEQLPFEILGLIIWVIFILDFILEFVLAPNKIAYLTQNWLTALSLLVPAVRIFRIFRYIRLLRLARVGKSLRLVRVVGSINRGMNALGENLTRRGFGYVGVLTIMILFAGAAGMYAFEREVPDGLESYGEALWWTAMIMTTLGSQYWPETFEGRVLCIFLSLYSVAIFGYITATLATFFIGSDEERRPTREMKALRQEIKILRAEISRLSKSAQQGRRRP